MEKSFFRFIVLLTVLFVCHLPAYADSPLPSAKSSSENFVRDRWKKGFRLGAHFDLGTFVMDGGQGNKPPAWAYGLEAAYNINRRITPFINYTMVSRLTDNVSMLGSNVFGLVSTSLDQTFHVVDFGSYYYFYNVPTKPYIKGGVGFYSLVEKSAGGQNLNRPAADKGMNFHGVIAAGFHIYHSRRHQVTLEGDWHYFNNGESDLGAILFGLGYQFVF